MSLQIYNLSHAFHQHIPEWPSSPGVNVTVDKFHAKDGVHQVNWEGIMHRCTHMDAPILKLGNNGWEGLRGSRFKAGTYKPGPEPATLNPKH